jgi:hypothetical protein
MTMLTDFYYLFASFAVIVVFIVAVLLLPIPLQIRIVIAFIITIYYRRNLTLMAQVLVNVTNVAYLNPLSTRSDDTILRKIVNSSFGTHFRLHKEFEKFPTQPSILVCNYCKDRMENIACILFPADIAIMMRDGLKKTVKLHRIVKWPIYTKAKGNYEDSKKQVVEHMGQGRYIFTYVTKHPRLRPDYIPVIRSGMFSIAKELGVPVTPVCIDYIDTRFGAIPYQNFRIRVGDTFMVDQVDIGMYKAKKFFKETMTEFKQRKYEGIMDCTNNSCNPSFRVRNMSKFTSR